MGNLHLQAYVAEKPPGFPNYIAFRFFLHVKPGLRLHASTSFIADEHLPSDHLVYQGAVPAHPCWHGTIRPLLLCNSTTGDDDC